MPRGGFEGKKSAFGFLAKELRVVFHNVDHNVGPADDADELASIENRNPAEVIFDKAAADIEQGGILTEAGYSGRHNVAYDAGQGIGVV